MQNVQTANLEMLLTILATYPEKSTFLNP